MEKELQYHYLAGRADERKRCAKIARELKCSCRLIEIKRYGKNHDHHFTECVEWFGEAIAKAIEKP